MRTAYINKENRVVYIAAFEEDKIIPTARGKLLFTAGGYDAATRTYGHTLGKGEEVFAVDGSGLGLGDTYIAPTPIEPAPENNISALESEVQAMEEKLKIEYLLEKNIDPTEFQVWVEEKANV